MFEHNEMIDILTQSNKNLNSFIEVMIERFEIEENSILSLENRLEETREICLKMNNNFIDGSKQVQIISAASREGFENFKTLYSSLNNRILVLENQ